MNFSVEQIAELKKLRRAIQVFRDVDPAISSITIATMLEVAIRGDEGVSVKYLEKVMDMPSASASRQLQILEKPMGTRKKGFGVADAVYDPLDPKGKLRVPTEKMEAIVLKLQQAAA